MGPMMSLREAATAIGARLNGEDVRFDSVSTDSRTLERGALFIALRGERFDGRRFIGAAMERGAAAAIVEEPDASRGDLPFLVVENSRLALGRLAAHWRGRFDIPLVAVSGSNGKTTVKEMIAAILREHFGETHALATEGNLNNDIGLPLTLLKLRPNHRAAVVELGVNHPGETATLAAVACPTVALINNAQREHQEFMKGVAEVAREHGALFAAMRPEGTGVINADDEFSGYWRGLLAGRRVRDFGLEKPAQVGGRHRFTHFGSELDLHTPQGAARDRRACRGRRREGPPARRHGGGGRSRGGIPSGDRSLCARARHRPSAWRRRVVFRLRRRLRRRGPTLRHRGSLDLRGSSGAAAANHDACKRLALHAHGAGRPGSGRRILFGRRALDAPRSYAMARPGRARVQCVPVHHAARSARDAHRPRDLAARRSAGDSQAHRL